jgi:hypothetical protein
MTGTTASNAMARMKARMANNSTPPLKPEDVNGFSEMKRPPDGNTLADRESVQASPSPSLALPSNEPVFDVANFYDAKGRLKKIYWYDTVRKDRNRKIINLAYEYYKVAIADAERHIVAIGHLQTLAAETPGLDFFYKGILTDVQQIRRWLEERLEIEGAQKYKWFMTSPEAKKEYGEVKTTEASKYVKADPDLADLSDDIRLLANAEHGLQNVAEGFQSRGIMVSKITDIRQHGLEEVFINPHNETINT